MVIRARNNKTNAGAKKRWSADDRAKRTDGPAQRPAAGRGQAPESRAARRAAQFGAPRPDDRSARTERSASDRKNDWYPGPRINQRKQDEGSGRDDRPRRDAGDAPRRSFGDRPQRTSNYDRPQRADRPAYNRDDRPAYNRDDRAPRQDRDDRRTERPAYNRDDRAPRQDRDDRAPRREWTERAPRRDDADRAPRRDFGDRAPRQDRDAPAPRREWTERPPRRDNDAPRRDFSDRAPRQDQDRAPRREWTERPPRQDRDAPRRDFADRGPRRDNDAPRRDDRAWDRAPRNDARSTDNRGAGHHGFAPHHADATAWKAPEDVVLEKLQAETVTAVETEGVTFADLGLGDSIVRALAELGAAAPFPIQTATIPDALAGRDLLGRGRTGSGKTIAFGAAMVERLLRNWAESGRTLGGRREMGRAPRAIILAPTRELALQIDRTIQPIARSVGLFTTQIVGGVPQARQVGALKKGVDIVIGTPGRMEDLIEQRHLDLRSIEIAVLDEADHMCELGFLEPIRRLLAGVPATGQRLLFSATLDSAVSSLVNEFLTNPAVHEVVEEAGATPASHHVLVIEQNEKLRVLEALLGSVDRSLVFARTRAFAEQLADELEDEGVSTVSLHGDLNQARRSRNLQRFSEGKARALVATDVAARGIHVDGIELVVHADAAEEYKTYLHRSGRTGRAGASGTVVTLITARRRRRFEELLARAEIEATFATVKPGGDPVAALQR
jgi:superfamily II DNA/RNA helicase